MDIKGEEVTVLPDTAPDLLHRSIDDDAHIPFPRAVE
jgi:hypothetical protein